MFFVGMTNGDIEQRQGDGSVGRPFSRPDSQVDCRAGAKDRLRSKGRLDAKGRLGAKGQHSAMHGAMTEKVSDKDLVALATKKDKEAYRVLVERYEKKALALAFEVTRTREDAEDVVQEAFVKAYLSLPSFKGDSSFYTWLYRIVYNMAIDVKRKRSRRGGDPMEYDERLGGEGTEQDALGSRRFADPHSSLASREQLVQVQKVLDEISEEHRAVIMLREVEGCSYDEIANVLGISKGTVMSRLFYARKKLMKGLGGLSENETSAGATDGDEVESAGVTARS